MSSPQARGALADAVNLNLGRSIKNAARLSKNRRIIAKTTRIQLPDYCLLLLAPILLYNTFSILWAVSLAEWQGQVVYFGGIETRMKTAAKIMVVILVIAVGGYFTYSKIVGWHQNQLDSVIKQQQANAKHKTDELEQKISMLEQELAAAKGQLIPAQKLAEVFGNEDDSARAVAEKEDPAEVMDEVKQPPESVQDDNEPPEEFLASEKEGTPKEVIVKPILPVTDWVPPAADLERRIVAFFSYLDEQPYIRSYGFSDGTYRQYQIAIHKLSAKPPIVAGEMQSIYNMVLNIAHFYRVMGKKHVFAARQILQNESDIIESVMSTFFQWFIADSDGPALSAGRPSWAVMYEYAGYLLNTLGGRSYLLRRNPKVRALASYYCVLVLDMANDQELNSKGIDIRPYLKTSLLEIKNQIGLIHQKKYLAKLSELNLKYQPF